MDQAQEISNNMGNTVSETFRKSCLTCILEKQIVVSFKVIPVLQFQIPPT